jgi:hypothetical protein
MNESEYYNSKTELDRIHGDRQHEMRIAILTEQSEYNLFSILKPRVFMDGNKWCVLYGDNITDGVAGFGDSPFDAVIDFNNAWNKKLPKGGGA